MGKTIQLEAADGHTFSAYRAEPASGEPRGGILVIQEIFGVNDHIRAVCDGFAEAGYAVIAPALFERVEKGVELGYDEAGIQAGVKIVTQLTPGNTLRDLQASADALSSAGKVGVVGYCYGGTMAWVSAARLNGIAAAVGYYGGQIQRQTQLTPRVPVMLHYGERDHSIPREAIDAVRAAHPDVPVHVYPAGHGFNCSVRADYDEASSKLALERTLAFFAEHVG